MMAILVHRIPQSTRRAAAACILLLSTSLISAVTQTSAADAAAISLPESLSSFANVALLDPRLELHWTVNDSDATIRLAVRANTAGWLAIAISEIGSMAGSDALVAWVAENEGRAYATDCFIFNTTATRTALDDQRVLGGSHTTNQSTTYFILPLSKPDALVAWVAENEGRAYATDCFIFNTTETGTALDDQQDWHVLGGSQITNQSTGDTWTTVHAWRLLDTGDCNDRPIVPGKLHNIIWASAPPSTASPSAAGSNSARGVGRLGVERRQVAGEVDVQAGMLNFTFTDYPVPTDRSSYRCMVIDVPLENKEHAVEWGPVINTNEVASLHHSFLYGCSSEEYPNLLPSGMIFDCVGRAPCGTFVAVWAWGGRPFTLPPNIGYPIGPGYFTKFVLEMHYVNPEARTDIVDSSGLYLKLAASRDLQDAAIMKVGLVDHTNLIRVPPGMPSWTLANSCPGECTAAVFKDQSVKIVGSILHEHNIGRQVYTEVLRGGSTVTTINRIDYFDYASQQTMPVQPEFELLPGDEIRTTCVWDSTTRTNVTVGGPAAENEMCVNYLVYYSATQIQEMHACYTVCGAIDNDTMVIDPSRLDLSTHYVCGPGHNPFIPTGKSCVISYGCLDNVTVLYGCPDQTKISLSTIPVDDISTPLQPGDFSPSAAAIAAASTANTNDVASPIDTNALASRSNTTGKAAPAAAADPRLELHWTVNDSDATIRLAVRANTAGWLAIGISEIGSMAGSDVLVAWVAEKEGRVYATDRFIFNTKATGIALDAKQDWHVLDGSQTTNQSTGDTWTTVHAWRLLDTGDCNDRPIISGKLHNIIWATGPTDDVSYHGSTRGGAALLLAPAPGPSILDPSEPPSTASAAAVLKSIRGSGSLAQAGQQQAGRKEEGEARVLKFTVKDYPVPTDSSSYRCTVIDVPLESKEHAVEWGPVINTTQVSSLHHAFLYGCSSEEYPNLLPSGMIFDCVGRAPCGTSVAVWAWGGRPFTFPPNVGYPIGPGYFTEFVLEVGAVWFQAVCLSCYRETRFASPACGTPPLAPIYLPLQVTVGGPAAENEMCVAYLVYYTATQGREMHACYTVCGAMDNGTLSIDPSRQDLSTHYVCGPGHNPFIPTNKPCTISFGSNNPVTVLHGCPDKTKASVSAIPLDAISTPLQPASPSRSPHAAALVPPAETSSLASPASTTGKAAPAAAAGSSSITLMVVLPSFLALLMAEIMYVH
ncbi:unnamed protein product [Closterium sp. Yama58-4]|nr:unnamed protein product [Closterium sp. Yama58-4]